MLPDGLKLLAIFHPFHFELRGTRYLAIQTDWITNCNPNHLGLLCDLRRLYNVKQNQTSVNLSAKVRPGKDVPTQGKSRHTLHLEGGKALILPSLIHNLTGVFPTVCHLTDRDSKNGHVVSKCSLNLWILQNPALVFLPLHRKRWRTCYHTLKLCLFTQNSGRVLNPLGECWWFYETEPSKCLTVTRCWKTRYC